MPETASDLPAAPSVAPAGSVRFKLTAFYVLIAAVVAACFFIRPATLVSESGVVMKWPDHVLDFTGKDEPVDPNERRLLPEDTEFAKKIYTDPSGDIINCEIVLSGVEHRSIHRPEICLQGQGWSNPGGEVIRVPLKSGRNLDVMVLDIERPIRLKDGRTVQLPALYAYFFVSKEAETPDHLKRLAITNLDLLLKNKAHRWAYVIAMAQVLKGLTPDGKDRAETLNMLKDFIREAAPQFLKSEMPDGGASAVKNPVSPAGAT